MGGVCQDPEGQWFVWRSPFSEATQARLVTDTNPTGDVTINDLEITALLAQVLLFSPKMNTLAHIRKAVDKMAAQGWANRGSVSSATAVGPILPALALLTRTHKIYSSVQRIAAKDNKMADAASILTHLTKKMFLCHFTLTFPQKNPWRLLTLLSGCRQRLTSMLHSKRCHMDSPPQSSKKTPPPGTNGTNSASSWRF